MFVIAVSGEARSWGVGKLLNQNGADCTVEYFDTPMAEPILRECLATDLRSVSLPAQSRVFVYNSMISAWEIGRILDDHGDTQLVKFPKGATRHLRVSEVFARWDRPISDPTGFLAAEITETPRFATGRAPFVRSLLKQRAAALGMSALPSSAIELEAHQVEVVRKVLQDPIQRYLLADEVGLGKTIEAGVLIRQCVLDNSNDAKVLILVPEGLVTQWRTELSTKFFLGGRLDETVFVEPFSATSRIRALAPSATMLVVDEAHHIAFDQDGAGSGLYEDLIAAAPSIDRILLLSATPALHNERGFLRMLHLLDPTGYPLDGETEFRKRVSERQALAEIVASLTPDNALYLDDALDELAIMFPDDLRLQDEAGRLRQIIVGMPSEDDPDLVSAVAVVRDHLSEVYRLHRRILRHRRRNVVGLTPDRSGAEVIAYRSPATLAAATAANEWRFAELTDGNQAGPTDVSLACSAFLMERRASYAVTALARPASPASVAAPEPFLTALRTTEEPERSGDRIDALADAVHSRLAPRVQFIVFCSDPVTADEIARRLTSRLGQIVDRHDPAGTAWQAFGDDPSRAVLVCDHRAEEGLNLQGGEKVIVHYDLPWNPNRVEQRIGRADRYGSGQSVRSLVLCCEDDPIEVAWTRYLSDALRVFDRSIASLQYFLEETSKTLPVLLLTEGAEGIIDLMVRDQGDDGLIATEIKNINQQDALDALGDPPTEAMDVLSDLDDEWRDIEADMGGWIQTTLMFGRSNEPLGATGQTPGAPFRYRYMTGAQHTLLPLEGFHQRCEAALDLDLRVTRSRDLWTVPYTCRRLTALSRQGRAAQARLLRYGDPLLTGLRELAQRDERGRSTAFWRHLPASRAAQTDVYFRFDFIIEAEVGPAFQILDLAGCLTPSAVSSLSRRGDMALAPGFHTVWLDSDRRTVTDPTLLEMLEEPYRVETSDQGERDFNLNPKRWQALRALRIPQLDQWGDLCGEARYAAEAHLRGLQALNEDLETAARRAETLDAGRLGLLRARAARFDAGASADERDLHLEQALSDQLIAGIREPKVSLDAVCACFVSSDLAVANVLARA